MRIKKLLMITGNQGKAREFESLLAIDEFKVGQLSMELEEIQSFDLEEIGTSKIRSALQQLPDRIEADAVLVDDTGLFCEGLNGLPGPFIKWFLERLKVEGLQELVKSRNTNTSAVCHLSLGLRQSGEIIHFRGEVEGNLVEARGDGGFGWDKIFQPKGLQETYGQLSAQVKNTLSHRTLAVRKLREWILST